MRVSARNIIVYALALACVVPAAVAQTKPEEPAKPSETKPAAPSRGPEIVQTIFLANAVEQNDLIDIQTALRNAMPTLRVYGVQDQSALVVKGTAEEIVAAQKLITELDLPRKLYRLTYTIAEIDGGKRTSARQYVLLAVAGQKTEFKQGSRMPIEVGTYDVNKASQNIQMQYTEVGLNIGCLVTGSPENLHLKTKVEQSSLSEAKSVAGIQDPVIQQAVLDESAELTQGKPLVIGSLDLPGTSKHQEIEVTAELVR